MDHDIRNNIMIESRWFSLHFFLTFLNNYAFRLQSVRKTAA